MEQVDNITILSGATILLIKEWSTIHKEHKISPYELCMHIMMIWKELSSYMSKGSTSSIYGNNMSRWSICMYGKQGLQKKEKEMQLVHHVWGQVQKCTTTTLVQVQCTKRTAPSSSLGKTTPNPYIICYIWVRGAPCSTYEGYMCKMHHHQIMLAHKGKWSAASCSSYFSSPKTCTTCLHLS